MIPKKENFECTHCGYCCTLTVLPTEKEIERIKAVGYDDKDFITVDRKGRKRLKQVNGYCYFLKVEHGLSSCSIYPARPEPCKKYPFFEDYTAECEPPRVFDVKFLGRNV